MSLIEVWSSHDGEREDQLLINGSRAELCGVSQDLNSSNFQMENKNLLAVNKYVLRRQLARLLDLRNLIESSNRFVSALCG